MTDRGLSTFKEANPKRPASKKMLFKELIKQSGS